MTKYALMSDAEVKNRLINYDQVLTKEDAYSFLGDMDPRSSKHTAGDGDKRTQRNVELAAYRTGFEVTGPKEKFSVTDFLGGNEVVLSGELTHDRRRPQSRIESSIGPVGYSDTVKFYPGTSITSSVKEAYRTVESALTGKKYRSPLPAIRGVGSPSLNQEFQVRDLKMGLSTTRRRLVDRSEIYNIVKDRFDNLIEFFLFFL